MDGSVLQLLGPVALRASREGKAVPLGRKAQAMLAYVASHDSRGTSRSGLVALLWPEQGDTDARNALRQCLHQIRHALAEHPLPFDLPGDRVVMREGDCEVDLRLFERLSAGSDPAAMVAAARLYQGEFAEGLDAGDGCNHWLAVERERLRGMAYGLALRLCDNGASAEQRDAAMLLARRLLAEDPVHEGCYRILMRLYAAAGLRAKALQVWEECCHTLHVELGVEPDSETGALHRRLLASAPVADGGIGAASTVFESAIAALAPLGGDSLQENRQFVDHLLRGWRLFTAFTAKDNGSARAEFLVALGHAPDHPEGLSMLGFTHLTDFSSGWSADPAASLAEAARTADRAIACNRGSHLPHSLRGEVLLWQLAHDAALGELQRAVTMNPGSAFAHISLATGAMWSGLYDEALAHVGRALRLDPNEHGVFLTIEGTTLYCKGELAAAQQALAGAIVRNPRYWPPYATMAALLAEMGKRPEARTAAAAARRRNRRLSLDFAATVMPIRRAELRERLVEGWRLAGMPEREGEWVEPAPQLPG